jgi:hypothetical protein
MGLKENNMGQDERRKMGVQFHLQLDELVHRFADAGAPFQIMIASLADQEFELRLLQSEIRANQTALESTKQIVKAGSMAGLPPAPGN